MQDSDTKGCYEKTAAVPIADQNMAILMIEASLHAMPEGKGALGLLLSNPAFFPFQLPVMTGDFIARSSNRIEVVRYGLDDEMLKVERK